KTEGDWRTPAGIFSIGSAFGFSANPVMAPLRMDYIHVNEFTEAVDDPRSSYYNTIVDSREVVCDWHSAERMALVPRYKIGLVINHNFPDPQHGKGSAIFFHIWRHENAYTAGCTAMSEENLIKLLRWVNKDKKPVLVQLPYPAYVELMESWNLP